MHVLDSDEIFHFYLGDPVEMLQLYPDGRSAVFTLGPDLEAGQHVQLVVPAGVWQGTRLIGDGKVALLGCTVTPGFDYADYRSASYAELVAEMAGEAERIKAADQEVRAYRRSRKKPRSNSAASSARIPCSTCIWWLSCGWLSTESTEPAAPALGSAAAKTSRSSRA